MSSTDDGEDEIAKAIVEQIAYVRDMFKWYDSRYTWSTLSSFGILSFMILNAVPIVRFGHLQTEYVEYLIAWVAAFLFFVMSMYGTAVGMMPFQLWAKRTREDMGCTTFLWTKNVSVHKTATAFADSIASLDHDALAKARAQELWRISTLVEQREFGLVWARLGLILLAGAALVFTTVVLEVAGAITLGPVK